MSYTKNTWQTGDVVTAAKLNNIEDGIVDAGIFVVHEDNNNVLDKTWNEIWEASASKIVICMYEEIDDGEVYRTMSFLENISGSSVGGFYSLTIMNWGTYNTNSPDGYPGNVVPDDSL